jgi:hypothetical protein
MMKRRRFLFWIGFGLFNLADRFHLVGLDRLAAAAMRLADPQPTGPPSSGSLTDPPEHWVAAENSAWYWFEREHYIGGRWKLTGVTTPVSKENGQPLTGRTGYLDESFVPAEMRLGSQATGADDANDHSLEATDHQPDPARRARHGRPPSKWLRSLTADELRIWFKTIDTPEAGVEGVTYWTHLTRDHFFDPTKIAGLTTDEQAKLHAAAHYGY